MDTRGQKLLKKFDEVFLLTLNASRKAFNEISRDMGITEPQLKVLIALSTREIIEGKTEGVTMRELSDMQMLSHGATTGLVDRMINMDLLERTRSEEDRRVVYVCLSEKGREIFRQITERRTQYLAPILDQLDTSQEQMILEALTILEARFKAEA